MYVAAFAVSGYASTANRPSRKPFNPLLGETFEYLGNGGVWRTVRQSVAQCWEPGRGNRWLAHGCARMS